jgi:hypothetical protein
MPKATNLKQKKHFHYADVACRKKCRSVMARTKENSNPLSALINNKSNLAGAISVPAFSTKADMKWHVIDFDIRGEQNGREIAEKNDSQLFFPLLSRHGHISFSERRL